MRRQVDGTSPLRLPPEPPPPGHAAEPAAGPAQRAAVTSATPRSDKCNTQRRIHNDPAADTSRPIAHEHRLCRG